MNCPSCQAKNSIDGKFCIECGKTLQKRCPRCQVENLLQAKFCMECGTPLLETSQLTKQQKVTEQHSQTERRQVSVMFCDLVDSTALAEQIDPEDLREMFLSYRELSDKVIRRNGGRIAKSFGDGLMVYFGYPIAYEDNPQRAIRAGLDIITQMRQLSTRLMQEKGVELNVRIGIHIGKAVVGDTGSGDTHEPMDIVGDTPNIAARLQTMAAPNTVVISAATYRIVQGYFDCESLGQHSLKGIKLPMGIYRVQKEILRHNRLEASVSSLTPFVGRERELKSIVQIWERVKSGNGQVVLLTGEAGMGKSRLVQVFKEYIATDSHNLRELYCSPYYINSPFYPVIEMFRGRRMQLNRGDSPAEQLVKLEQWLGEYELDMAQVVPIFAAFFSIPLNERYKPLNLSPQAQKQKTIEILRATALTLTQQKPLVIIAEDLHWLDASTMELFNLLIKSAPMHRLLLLCTARPIFQSPWINHEHFNPINLTALADEQTELLVKGITGDKTLPKEVLKLVIAKSDRIPLFVEEITRMVLESGWLKLGENAYELTGQIPQLAIPDTLQDLLMARIDQLAPVKEVAQIGATIGREFSYELLLAIWSKDEITLNRALEQLVKAQLLLMSEERPAAKYLFKHALIQEAVYDSLLKSTRKQYHQQIALVLEQQFPETVEREPELLAYHYTKANLREQAIHYWHLAGQKAVKSSAYVEAIDHLTSGLELNQRLPESRLQQQQELALQTILGVALRNTKGYAAPEVELTYKRSEELCQLLGETEKLFWIRWGLWAFYTAQAKLQTALVAGEQLMAVAAFHHNDGFHLEAHYSMGLTLLSQGKLAAAGVHFEQAIAIYNPQQHHSQILLTGQDAGVAASAIGAWQLWVSGFPEQALCRSHEAHALAVELSNPYMVVFTFVKSAFVHQYRRDWQATKDCAEAAIALSTQKEFVLRLAFAVILWGWALAESGQIEEGIVQLHRGLDIHKSTGALLFRPYFFALLVEAYLKAAQVEDGLSVVNRTIKTVEETGECCWEAELYRLKGELLRVKAEEGMIEDCFYRAIAISRRQGAKSLELRAVMSLARLWQQQGKREAARQLLSGIYGWFTEGFDTKDLIEAKLLLEEA